MGQATFGKYRLIAELGHGGMADVFLAVQAGPAGSGFRKLMVVKRLRPNLADEPEFVAMLVDEARIAARLNHPNVVQTNEVGSVGQHYFIAMEYLDGQPLHRIQHRNTQRAKDGGTAPISKGEQYVIVMDALAGLHHAHELADYDGTPLQIVHRDMTPHNIFVTYAGQVKVVDFGIAKAAGRSSETRQGVVKGKVRYMAPEQAIGRSVDRRADVFSVGVILWETVAGRRMWKDMDDMQIVQALVNGDVPSSPRSVDPNVPEGLDAICKKALACNPDERYATAEEFRSDLESYLAESKQLVEARRQLAPAVSELFKDKRDEIKSVIERQLAALDETTSGESFQAVPLPPDSQSSPTALSLAVGRGPESQTGFTNQKTQVYDPKSSGSPRQSLTRVTTIAVAAALAAAGFLLVWRASSKTTTTSAPITAPEQADVAVRLNVTPTNAQVFIDDGPARTAPIDIRLPKDDKPHTVRFEAPGHVTKTETIHLASDLAMSIDLRPNEAQSTADKRNKPTHGTAAAPPPVVTIVRTVTAPAKTNEQPTAAAPPTPPPPTPTNTAAAPTPTGPSKAPPPKIDNGDPWANK